MHLGWMIEQRSNLQETLYEVLRQLGLWLLLCLEVLEHMRKLLPVVECLLCGGSIFVSDGFWRGSRTNLELLMRVEQQHVNCLELLHVSMSFKLLSDLCSYVGNGHVEGVHLLDFRALSSCQINVPISFDGSTPTYRP